MFLRAVALNRLLLIFSLFLFTQGCNASPSERAEKAYELALNNFLQAKKKYENKIIECNSKKKVIVSPEFQAIDLSEEEQALVLVVLNTRAEFLCEKIELGNFSIASSIYRTTANHYNKQSSIAANYTEDLVFGHYWRTLQLEAKYLEIDKKKREYIENIRVFKQPFFPFKTASKLPKKLTIPSN